MSCGGSARNDFNTFAQPDLLAYARELRDTNNKRDMLDFAKKVHAKADNYCWTSEDGGVPVAKPSGKMSTEELHDNVVQVCQQTLARGMRKSSAQPKKYCGGGGAYADEAIAQYGSKKSSSSGKRRVSPAKRQYSYDDEALNSADLVAEYKQQLRSMFGSETAVDDDDAVDGEVLDGIVAENGEYYDDEDDDGDVRPMELASKKKAGSGKGRRTRTIVVPKDKRHLMASNIIKAVKYQGQPYSSEVRQAKAKQIDWDIDVDSRYVSVVRRNNASRGAGGKQHVPTETHYVYHTPSDGDFRALVSSVQKERDRLVRVNRNYAGPADASSAAAPIGETSAQQTGAQRVEMMQIPAFWLTNLLPRLGLKKESEAPDGSITFRKGQLTLVTKPCDDNKSNVCNATINGIDAKKLATQLMSLVQQAGGLRGILGKLPGGAGGALGRLGQLGGLSRLLG